MEGLGPTVPWLGHIAPWLRLFSIPYTLTMSPYHTITHTATSFTHRVPMSLSSSCLVGSLITSWCTSSGLIRPLRSSKSTTEHMSCESTGHTHTQLDAWSVHYWATRVRIYHMYAHACMHACGGSHARTKPRGIRPCMYAHVHTHTVYVHACMHTLRCSRLTPSLSS